MPKIFKNGSAKLYKGGKVYQKIIAKAEFYLFYVCMEYVGIYVYLVCPLVCLSVCLSVFLSIFLSTCLSIFLSTWLSICLFVSLFIYLSVIYLSIHLSLPQLLGVFVQTEPRRPHPVVPRVGLLLLQSLPRLILHPVHKF